MSTNTSVEQRLAMVEAAIAELQKQLAVHQSTKLVTINYRLIQKRTSF